MRLWEFDQPQAAGCIIVAADTGRWCLQQRSQQVSDPGIWSTWGGGREPGESLEQCVIRELAEESGYNGPVKLSALSENSRYRTYLALVPHEFRPRLNEESQNYCWVDQGDWPQPLHENLVEVLQHVSGDITVKDIHRMADHKHIAWDNDPEFLKLSKKLTGIEHLDDMDQKQLQIMYDHLKSLKEKRFGESSYVGNIGIMELIKFFQEHPEYKPMYKAIKEKQGATAAMKFALEKIKIELIGEPYVDENFADGKAEGKLNFEGSDCPIFAIALHRLSKMPLMALIEYDDQIGSTVLIHAYVKLDDRWRLDASGETDVNWMLQKYPNNGHAEEVEISEKDLLELGYGKNKCPTLQQVLPYAKEVLQNIEGQQGVAEAVKNLKNKGIRLI